jgi:enolase
MSKIIKVHARQIFDSRGNPTVEVDVLTKNGFLGRAAVPSGASTGEHEAVELRDGGSKYMGKGVLNAVSNVNRIISKEIIGQSVFDQKLIDDLMIKVDGTPNKVKLGANAILGVSLAVAKAASNEKGVPLYSYISEEFMIMPVKADSFTHAMQIGTEIFHNLKTILSNRGLTTSVGDEGGFAPKLDGTEDALNTIIQAIEKSGYSAGDQVMIALDCASSEFYVNGMYDYSKFEGMEGKILNSKEQAEYLSELSDKYPIISIEDGMDENDWNGWEYLTKICGDNVQLVGDDLFVTNVERLSNGIKNKIGNSILIKVNQIGTLSETIDAVKMAHAAGFTSVMSHRSGETEDNTIADLSVGLSTGQIKTGSASRSDRVAKYNQLLRIEEELGERAYYPKEKAFKIQF